ncbi:hypothetical protein C8J56DRAFT_1056184 [Mycena floridula]|nr:hypothetical protein C8J56DRAFT_1056184 [Mycena floridula]
MSQATNSPVVSRSVSPDLSRQCPLKECTQPVDIILKSSQGILIGAHRCHLGRFSDGFPSSESVTGSIEEIVPLDENTGVLLLLLEYLHPQRLPDIKDVGFELLLGLAYAAEKYQVYSAMSVCSIHLSQPKIYEEHPADILYYAVRHRYKELADLVAPLTIGIMFKEIYDAFQDDSDVFSHWALFFDAFGRQVRLQYEKALGKINECPSNCRGWGINIGSVILQNCAWPPPITSLEETYRNHTCANCRNHYSTTYTGLLQLLRGQGKALPSFSAFHNI